ncbi:MAG: hypothetical protein WC796_04660 [Candidatus Pacearchaeota archaeon]|jgi:hypothetical protein
MNEGIEPLEPGKWLSFVARHNSPKPENQIPFRCYFHDSVNKRSINDESTLNDLTFLLNEWNRRIMIGDQSYSYLIGLDWGDRYGPIGAERYSSMLDLVAVSDIDTSPEPQNWPGNPVKSSFVFKEGVWQPENREVTCGDGWLIVAAEELYRRKCRNLQEYLNNPPKNLGLFA